MLGLSFPRTKRSATPSASPPDQNQKSKRESPLTRTFRKLKRAVARSSSKEIVSASNDDCTHQNQSAGRQPQAARKPSADTNKPLPPIPLTPTQPTTGTNPRYLPRVHEHVATTLPSATTAAPTLSNTALLSNPSELDRFLARYPKPKIVYTQAEAKAVVEAFIANAKYEEDLARNTDLSHKVPKPREDRPSRRDRSLEVRMTSSKYSTHATGCDLQAAPKSTVATGNPLPPRAPAPTKSTTKHGPRHLPKTADGVASSLPIPKTASSIPPTRGPLSNRSNPDRSHPRPKIVYAPAEAKAVVQDIRRLEKVPRREGWQDTRGQIARSHSKLESLPTAGCSVTTDQMETIMQDPTRMESVWNRPNVASRSSEYKADFKHVSRSGVAKHLEKRDIERQDRARGHAYLKLVGGLR